MRRRFVLQAVLATLLICQLSVCLGKEAPDPADPNRYLNAVREFADNVLLYGKDTYGPKHTPLFVDGLNVNTHEPVKWIAPNGARWILSNLASQQNLFRTLDGLTRITGDPKYKQAAMDAIKYAFENLRSPNGLLYWGHYTTYDAQGDTIRGDSTHSLKSFYPYYELMWEVNPDVTKQLIESLWASHILDWSNLDMNRLAPLDRLSVSGGWKHEYKDGPVFFDGKGVSFLATGSDLFYAAILMTNLSGDKEPCIWGKRLAHRYVETRNPRTGIGSNVYSLRVPPEVRQFQDDFKEHFADPYTKIFPSRPALYDQNYYPVALGWIMNSPGTIESWMANPWICELMLGEMLGSDGEEFTRWALEEFTAWGKIAYRKRDNAWVPMLTDGTSLEGYVFKIDGYHGPKGTMCLPHPVVPMEFWGYALAYRITGDPFMWEMTRSIGQGLNIGDIGSTAGQEPRLNMRVDCSDPFALQGFIELYSKTGQTAFLRIAQKIGDNILNNHFHKGFFVASGKHIYTKFNAIDTLVLLHLATLVKSSPELLPKVWPDRSFFQNKYRGKDVGIDNSIIYTLTESPEPPLSLNEAAAIGNLDLVKSFIVKGINVDYKDDSALRTPLQRAVEGGYKDIVEFLLVNGADVNTKRHLSIGTPLHYAAALRDGRDVIELLLAKGADINAENSYGDTPLQYAAYNDRKDTIELLLQKGATIANLHTASYMGDLVKIEAFIQEGKDINALDGHGYAPLHYAARNNQKESLELLIAKGADINVKSWSGQVPLDLAISQNRKDIVELLIAKGADISARNKSGNTPLDIALRQKQKDIIELFAALSIHVASYVGDLEKVKAFLDKGADVNTRDKNGSTPLHLAANKDIAELLIAKGADVNAKDLRGCTPLFYVIINSRTDIAKLLIAKDIDISTKDSSGFTPLQHALLLRKYEIAELIVARGVGVNAKDSRGWTPLHHAAYNGVKELSELLIDKGADISARNKSGNTPLDAAVAKNSNPVVDLLIAKGAVASTLNVAAYKGDLDKIKAALEDGIDVNVKNTRGETLLYSAALEGHKYLVEFLIAQGADVNGKSNQAKPALHAAVTGGHKDVVELLLAKGADINIRDSEGRTPLQIAEKAGSTEIADLLRQQGTKE